MPYKVHCHTCEITDAVRTRDEAESFHGQWHAVRVTEVSDETYSAIKRGKRTHGGNSGGGAPEGGGTCPLCGEDYDGFLPHHLPDCPEA